MKLNIECVRELLMFVENSPYMKEIPLGKIVEALCPRFTFDEVRYAILKLEEANFIVADIHRDIWPPSIKSIRDITYEGHQFLAAVRPKSVWQKLSAKIKTTGVEVFPVIADHALDLAKQLLENGVL